MENYLRRLSGDLRLVGIGDYFDSLLQQRAVSPRQIAHAIGVPYRSFMNYLRNTRAMPLGIALRVIRSLSSNNAEAATLLEELYQNVFWVTSTASTAQTVRLPKHFSEELAYLIGAIHDGTVFANAAKNQYLIQYWQFSDPQWLKIVARKLEMVFARKPKRYAHYVQLSNKAAYEFFAKVLRIPQRQVSWDSFLRGIPVELQLQAIAGMFDAEGWVGTPHDLRIKFSQKNKYKLAEVKRILRHHAIASGGVIPENDGHALWLCGKSCIDFAAKVGRFCEHRTKRQKLAKLSLLNMVKSP